MELPSINQLWVTYVTYIWLETEFVDLAATLDVYSRSVIGWALDRTLDASLAEGRSTCLKIAPRQASFRFTSGMVQDRTHSKALTSHRRGRAPPHLEPE